VLLLGLVGDELALDEELPPHAAARNRVPAVAR
jgi:hypothetical protein